MASIPLNSAMSSSSPSTLKSSSSSALESSSAYVVMRALHSKKDRTPFERGERAHLFCSIPSSDMRTKITARVVYARNNYSRYVLSAKQRHEMVRLRRQRLTYEDILTGEIKRRTHPLRLVYNTPDEDERFEKFDACTIYTANPPWLGVRNNPQDPLWLIPSKIPQLRNLVDTVNLIAAASLEKGLDWLLYDLARSIGIDAQAPTGKGKSLDASVILDIPAPGVMMPGQDTIFIRKQVTSKGDVWHVKLPRVSAQQGKRMSADSKRKVQDAEDAGQLMIMRFWYSRFPVEGKISFDLHLERDVTDPFQSVNSR
jgi:hypothetical protein